MIIATPSLVHRLGLRLAFLMAVTLLPLGIVAYLQTRNLATEAQARTEAALMGASLKAASEEIGAIRVAQGVVAGLAGVVPGLMGDTTACVNALRQAADQTPRASLVAFVPQSGRMICSSSGAVFDYSSDPLFQQERGNLSPSFLVSRKGPVTGTSVLGILHPVLDGDGTYLGYLSVWIPHSALTTNAPGDGNAKSTTGVPITFWTFDSTGTVLTASNGVSGPDPALPVNRTLDSFIGSPGGVFQDKNGLGKALTYAVVPLAEQKLYLIGSWNSPPQTALRQYGLSPTLFPLLMWLAGLVVSVWAAELLVLRHVRALHGSISAFAAGDRRRQELDLRGAPTELREMGDAYLRMTDAITQDEARLEDIIHQKEVLLREVHHRVKNNLQLIASIMNMQMRQSRTPETKALLKGLQDRVMSLATIHRGLYQTSGLVDVRADELLSDITRQIVNLGSGPGKTFAVDQDFEDLRVTPDQAVPLSLLLTEAMTNAMKYAGKPNGGPARIRAGLKRAEGGNAILEVVNTLGASTKTPVDDASGSTGLGAQLLTAFAQQVGGKLEQGGDGAHYRLSVLFPVRALKDAEFQEGDDTEEGPTIPPASAPA